MKQKNADKTNDTASKSDKVDKDDKQAAATTTSASKETPAEVPADVKDMLADLSKFCRAHHAVIDPPKKKGKNGKTEDAEFLRKECESLRDKLKAGQAEVKEAKNTQKALKTAEKKTDELKTKLEKVVKERD